VTSFLKAVSNVLAAIILIGITIVGFAIAYPIFFAKARGVGGAGSLLDNEIHSKSVKLVLVDYEIVEKNSGYHVKLWIYNAGWATADIVKVMTPNGYTAELQVSIKPGETKVIELDIPINYGGFNRIIIVEKSRPFIFELK